MVSSCSAHRIASKLSSRWTATSSISRRLRTRHSVVLLRAQSNRMVDLRPLIPELLGALADLKPGQIVRVGA